MIDRLYLLFEVLALVIGLYALHEKKKKPTIVTLVYIAVQLIIETSIQMEWLPQQTEQILYIGLIVVCMHEFKDKIYHACLYSIIDVMLLGILQMLCAIIMCLLFRTLYISPNIYLVINVISFGIVVILYKFCNCLKFVSHILENGMIGGTILVIAAIGYLYAFGDFKNYDKIYWKTALEMLFCFLIFAFIFYEWQKEKWMNRQKEEELKTFEQYNLIYKDLIQEVRRRQHDFNNHIQAIFSMNTFAEDLEELVKEQNEYCSKMLAENMANKLLREDIPSVLAGFLYTKIGQAEKKGIVVKHHVAVDGIEKYIRFSDLVEVLGNLFDNAMEAVLHEEQKLIECSVLQEDDKLMIEVSNPCAWKVPKMENMADDGVSTKGDNRGLGLGNVKRIVEKYHGELAIRCIDKMGVNFIIFRAYMMLEK